MISEFVYCDDRVMDEGMRGGLVKPGSSAPLNVSRYGVDERT